MAEQIAKRSEIDSKFKWDLSPVVKDDEAFEARVAKFFEDEAKISEFRGKLSDKEQLLACLKLESELSLEIEHIYCYAFQRHDENAQDGKTKAMNDKAMSLYVRLAGLASYIEPELAEQDTSYLEGLKDDARFADYSVTIDELLRTRTHTLSEKEEALIANMGDVNDSFSNIFNTLDNADLKFPKVPDGKGGEVELSHSRYGALLENKDREVRRAAYEAYYDEYKKVVRTIGQIYIGNVKKDAFLAKARNFGSSMEYAMFYENVDKGVYEHLLDGVQSGLPALHEYISLRKSVLGLPDIRFYDLYTTMIEGAKLELTYDEAYDLVKKALLPLGADYQQLLTDAKKDGWIDVYTNEGKRSGAYSNSVYDVHPYVLLNYEKSAHDVFTIAHELGHAMHSHYSNTNLPYEKAGYKIFVAEVASTVNEVLLLRYLIDNTTDVKMKKFCLNYFLDMFRTTLFRQTMFSEFEAKAHGLFEAGTPLTDEVLSNEYEALNKKYYGEEIIHDDYIRYEWARIPHFYRGFYVYKYATGLTSAVTIAYNILAKGDEYVAKYKKFLSSGCSMAPTDLLKIADVDLTTFAPFENAMNVFKGTLDELKKLL